MADITTGLLESLSAQNNYEEKLTLARRQKEENL